MFMLRAQQVTSKDDRAEQGYAMVIISIITIFVFSLLGAFVTLSNLSKASTNAYVDGTNAFYVAESGLNRRADLLRQKFTDTITPTGTYPVNISSCFSTTTTATATDNDFECRSYGFKSRNNTARVTNTSGVTETKDNNEDVNYTAYTYVAPAQDYSTTPPALMQISSGQPYAGLNALEYQYNVYSTAKKNTLAGGDANVVLQMSFKSRVVPLFQFAAFYEEDLEMDSQMPMSVGGAVHTNGNLRAISYGFARSGESPYGTPNALSANFNTDDLQYASTRLLGNVTIVGSIYDRITASTWRPSWCSGSQTAADQTKNCGVMAVYKGSAADPSSDYNPANYAYFPDFDSTSRTTPLTATELLPFGSKMLDGSGGVRRLNPPKPGFLREKNYKTGEVGTYSAKADMRLKFFPSRAIPFSFTSIKSGGSGCAGFDIASDRQGFSTLSCASLTKGQLWSLQQPILRIATLPTSGSNDEKILKAIKVAIASSSSIITPYELKQPLPTTPTAGWQSTLNGLLPSGVTWSDIRTATPQSIEQILTSKGGTSSEILPPPIQVISGTSNQTDLNLNTGGFYNSPD